MNDQNFPVTLMNPGLVGFENQFFVLNPSQNNDVNLRSNLEWDREVESELIENNQATIIIDSPFVLVPETMYVPGMDPLLLQDKYPYLSLSATRYQADTWTNFYTKCVFYIPDKYYRLKGKQYHHWLTSLAVYNQKFFDAHDTGIWAFRLKDKLYVFVKVNRVLQQVKILNCPSPDDSTYHLLKIVETIKEYQSILTIWTNEYNNFHLSILNQYIPNVIVNDIELPKLLIEIISPLCG
ncbi:MAG: hypothetical protein ABI761_10205 [Saprospiraceae bacterium]